MPGPRGKVCAELNMRRRWLFTLNGEPLKEPIEITDDWRDPGRSDDRRSDAERYNNVQATDGTDLSSRTKYNRYMKEKGVTHQSDFTQHLQKKREERNQFYAGAGYDKSRREDIGRTIYRLKEEYRKRRG